MLTKLELLFIIIIAILVVALLITLTEINYFYEEIQRLDEELMSREITLINTINDKKVEEVIEDKDEQEINEKESIQEETKPTSVRDLLKKYCNDYDVDYYLAAGISRWETGNWTSDLYKNNNNLGGMRTSEGWCSYDSLEEGVDAFVFMLKVYYINRGLDTPEKMESKYCGDGSDWAKNINIMIKEEKALNN